MIADAQTLIVFTACGLPDRERTIAGRAIIGRYPAWIAEIKSTGIGVVYRCAPR